MLVGVGPASDLGVAKFLLGMATDVLQPRDAIDGVDGQAKAIGLVVYGELHWCIDVALLLVSAHVYRLVLTSVSKAMDQPWITVKIENDRFIAGEKRVEVRVGQTVRMLSARLQLEKIDNVNETDLDIREFLAQQHGAAKASCVGISPAEAITSSGSLP